MRSAMMSLAVASAFQPPPMMFSTTRNTRVQQPVRHTTLKYGEPNLYDQPMYEFEFINCLQPHFNATWWLSNSYGFHGEEEFIKMVCEEESDNTVGAILAKPPSEWRKIFKEREIEFCTELTFLETIGLIKAHYDMTIEDWLEYDTLFEVPDMVKAISEIAGGTIRGIFNLEPSQWREKLKAKGMKTSFIKR